jgi:hypothetical protein
MMKYSVFIILLLVGGCTAEQVEEIAFRKVMEYQLIEVSPELVDFKVARSVFW